MMPAHMDRIDRLHTRRHRAFTGLAVTVPLLWLALVLGIQEGGDFPAWMTQAASVLGAVALLATGLLWAVFVRVRWDLDHDETLAGQVDDERVRDAFHRAAWDAWRLTLVSLVACWGLDIFRPLDWRLAASVVTLVAVMTWLLRFLQLDREDAGDEVVGDE